MLDWLNPYSDRSKQTEKAKRLARAPGARRMFLEPLEDRRMMAVLPLGDLRDNGPLDAQGFILNELVPQNLAGFSVSNAGDVNADGFDDLLVGAPVAPGFPAGTGSAYVVYGKSSGFSDLELSSSIDSAAGEWLFGLNAADHLGYSVSDAGDVNADGFQDYIIGAPYADRAVGVDSFLGTGEAYLVFGSAGSPPALNALNGINGFRLQGLLEFDRAGSSVASAGDVNGDGFDDFLIGAPSDELSVTAAAGKAYLVYGKDAAFDATVNLWELTGSDGLQLFGLGVADQLGSSVSGVGDLNGDGFADFAVSAPYADPNNVVGAGSAYVIFGGTNPANGVNILDGSNGFRVDGFLPNERAGFSLSSAGDVNGDGFEDLLVGAPGDRNDPWNAYDYAYPSGAGRAYVVFGKANGFSATIDLSALDGSGDGFSITGIDGVVVANVDGVDYAGFSASSVGDVDGDGYADLVVGAPSVDVNGVSGVGESYLIFGRPEGFASGLTLATLTDDQGIQLVGDRFLEHSGYSVSGAGDINGDGFDDLIVGAPTEYPYAGFGGRSYVLFGRDFRNKQPIVGTEDDSDLTGTSSAEAIIGGQGNDLVRGAGGADVLRGGQGDDVLGVGDLTFLQVAGGRGNDTLRLVGSGIDLDLTTIPDARLTGIEAIDITGTGDNSLTIGTLQEILNLSDTSNRVVVRRDLGDTVSIGTGWTAIAPLTLDGVKYRSYVQGAATLLVENPAPTLDLNGTDDSGTGFATAFDEDQPPVAIVDVDLTTVDETSLVSATATITNLLNGDEESLSVNVGVTGLNASYSSTFGRLTLSGTASSSVYQEVLRTLKYLNVSNAPELTDRAITVVVNDGQSDSGVASATVTLSSSNDAPILSQTPAPVFPPVSEDTANPAGNTVAAIVSDGSINDPDGNTIESIAVVGADDSNGTWQYSVANQWVDLGSVSSVNSRLLQPDDFLRFVPNPDFNGTATLSFRAWDQTAGVGGTVHDASTNGGRTAFSFNVVTATLTVSGVNDAPILDANASHSLTTLDEDDTTSVGDAISGFIAPGSITDIDGPTIGGIAITSVDDANGVWQYSDAASSWTTISASATSALLLSANRRVRFVPNANYQGTAFFQFRAWDQSTGTVGGFADTTTTGGTTPFSSAEDAAFITVVEIDDLPTLDALASITLDVSGTSQNVALTGISDGDEGLEFLTVTATSNNPSVVPNPTVTYTSPDATGNLLLEPVANVVGSALITVKATEADGDLIVRTFLVSLGDDASVWQNPANPRDVDNSGFVVPLDALVIVNELNNPRFRDANGRLPLPPPPGSPPPYFDVNGDAFVTPLDVLIVINFLNNRSNAEGEAAASKSTVVSPSLDSVQDHDVVVGERNETSADIARVLGSPAASHVRDHWFAGLSEQDDDLVLELDLAFAE